MLRERGHDVQQAKDRFGEDTNDGELLHWCGEHGALLVSNNAKDFEELHGEVDHAGLLLYYDQNLPDEDPEGVARTVEKVLEQYSSEELANSVVTLDGWYDWLQK